MPYLSSIAFEISPNSTSRVKALQMRRAHVAINLNPNDALALNEYQWIRISHSIGTRIIQIYLNTQSAPFNKKTIRLAIALGINTEAIVKDIFHDYATVAETCIPPWSWAHEEDYKPIRYDPEMGIDILNSEGYNKNNPLHFSLLVNEESKFLQLAGYIATELSKINVFVNIISLPEKELFNCIYEGSEKRRSVFQAALEDWRDFRYERDPSQFTSELYQTSSPYNKVRLSDPVLDNIFIEIDCSETFSGMQELYLAAEKRIMNAIASLYLCYPHYILGSHSRLKNLKINPFYEINFKDTWLQ